MAKRHVAQMTRSLRDQRSWSQSHLAEAAGLSTRTIQRLEKHGECSQETLLSVAAAFDVDVQQFTALFEQEESSNQDLMQLNREKHGLRFSLKNWIVGKRDRLQQLMATVGGLLLVLPTSFFSIGVLKYTLGFSWIPNPFDFFYSTDLLASFWDFASPLVFLGSLVAAFLLNLVPFLDINLQSKPSEILSSIRYQGSGWNWAILLFSLIILGCITGYVIIENVTEHAILQYTLENFGQ